MSEIQTENFLDISCTDITAGNVVFFAVLATANDNGSCPSTATSNDRLCPATAKTMVHAPLQLPAMVARAQLQPTTMVHTPLQLPAMTAHAQL